MGQKSQAGKCRSLTSDNEAQMGKFKKEKTEAQKCDLSWRNMLQCVWERNKEEALKAN